VRRARAVTRGALLLEVMLALGIFVMAGTAILTLVDRTVEGMDRVRLTRHAADLARSAMAKMEAGIETPQTLSGPVHAWSAEEAGFKTTSGETRGGGVVDAVPIDSEWELQVDTEASQFHGLTRVTVKAFRRAGEGSDRMLASYTLRQLVRLGGKGADSVGGADATQSSGPQETGPAPKRSGP
jgi:hypothetical protein